MTVFKDPRTRVDGAVAAAVAFLEGGTPVATTTLNNGAIDVPVTLLASVTVTLDNVQAALIDTGYSQGQRLHRHLAGKAIVRTGDRRAVTSGRCRASLRVDEHHENDRRLEQRSTTAVR